MRISTLRLFALLVAPLFLFGNSVQAQGTAAPKYQQGIHYILIENAPVTTGGQVEVVEAFSYMCTHCATFEPYIASWEQRKPEFVVFKRIPVVFGRGSWELYARAYVTAEVMGIADEAHGALMDRIWKQGKTMRTMEELADFYSAYGVEASAFLATSKSFAVDAKLRKDQRTVQTAGVRGTPSLIVGGKYLVAGSEAVPNYDVMLDVVDFLVAADRAEQLALTPAAADDAEQESGQTADDA